MDSTELLIEEVRKNECLFDLSNKDYKNVYKKNELWEEIAKSLHLSAVSCRKRWKGLRDTYQRHMRAAQLAAETGAHIQEKKWRYMDQMSFLENHRDSRSTFGNIKLVPADEVVWLNSPSPQQEDITTTEWEQADCGSFQISTQPSITKKRKKKEVDFLQKTVEQLENLSKQAIRDEAEVFSEGWAIMYRKLDDEQKMYAKRIIDEALMQGHLGRLTYSSSLNLGKQLNTLATSTNIQRFYNSISNSELEVSEPNQ